MLTIIKNNRITSYNVCYTKLLRDGTTVTVTDNSLVTISFAVDNTNTYDNGSAANAQDFTATASVSGGLSSNGVSDNGSDGTYNDATDVARPNTSGISTN